MSDGQLVFPPFRLDLVNEQFWKESELVPLRPKPFAVLRYLVEHAGRLVTREELQTAIWPGTYISEGLLRGYVRDLRDALGDNADAPRFIETVPRRGYRFLAAVVSSQQPGVSSSPTEVASSPPSLTQHSALRTQYSAFPAPSTQHPTPMLVGRDAELAQLHRWWEKAVNGQRQVVFVTGEPGIGKTAVVEAFLHSLESRVQASEERQKAKVENLTSNTQHPTPIFVGWGQCVEHYGAGEAYLPVLEALSRLCRQPGGDRIVDVLKRHAPTWLVQLPALVTDAEFAALQQKVQGATRERMLREMAEALEVLTATISLVLVCEDLHWSDYATLDLLAVLARRREPARLLILGSYRPADIIIGAHPLRAVKQELQAHRQCEELPLDFLTVGAVQQHLAQRFSDHALPLEVSHVLHHSTDGNPLFVVNVIDYWIGQGVLAPRDGQWRLMQAIEEVAVGVPDNLRQMIEKQLDCCAAEGQRLLEVASVVGEEFSATTLAAAMAGPLEEVEDLCERLAHQGHILQARGTWTLSDGVVVGRYGFAHALYQQVLYERLPSTRRVRLHRRIGAVEEAAYGARAEEHAAELAAHFERGQDLEQAVRYLTVAGRNAVHRSAHHETVALFTRALSLLDRLPETPDRSRQELTLRLGLGPSLIAARGYADSGVEQLFMRALVLADQLKENKSLLPAIAGLFRFYLSRAELTKARGLSEQVAQLASGSADPLALSAAHCMLGIVLGYTGEFASSDQHFKRFFSTLDDLRTESHVLLYGQDLEVTGLSYASRTLWMLGFPEQAYRTALAALTRAREINHPFMIGFARLYLTTLHLFRREPLDVQEHAEALTALAREHGFPQWTTQATSYRGWALVEQQQTEEGRRLMQASLAAEQEMGIELGKPRLLALLAEVYGRDGHGEKALALLSEAQEEQNKTGERIYEAELWRLRGELLLRWSATKRPTSAAHSSSSDKRSRRKEA